MTVLAALPNLAQELSPYRGRRVYLTAGEQWIDHGDHLMLDVTKYLFEESGLHRVRSFRAADLIVILGGVLKKTNQRYAAVNKFTTKAPNIPLIVLPSTFEDDFAEIDVSARTSPITFFARERTSLAFLKGLNLPSIAHVAIDHDIAMSLAQTSYLERLRMKGQHPHLLAVERQDAESNTVKAKDASVSQSLLPFLPSTLKSHVPFDLRMTLQRPINRLLWQRKQEFLSSTAFVHQGMQWAKQNHGIDERLPVLAADISLPDLYSYDEYLLAIANASAVITTRLHVGLVAAILGKPVYLKAGQSHKIPAVHDYSLSSFENVHLAA